jgi:hypothetical protein
MLIISFISDVIDVFSQGQPENNTPTVTEGTHHWKSYSKEKRQL